MFSIKFEIPQDIRVKHCDNATSEGPQQIN